MPTRSENMRILNERLDINNRNRGKESITNDLGFTLLSVQRLARAFDAQLGVKNLWGAIDFAIYNQTELFYIRETLRALVQQNDQNLFVRDIETGRISLDA